MSDSYRVYKTHPDYVVSDQPIDYRRYQGLEHAIATINVLLEPYYEDGITRQFGVTIATQIMDVIRSIPK